MGFGTSIRTRDGLQIGGSKDSRAPAFHLLEIDAAADITEKDETFERFDVGAGGDHVHRDSNAELGRGEKLSNERFTVGWFAGVRMPRLVGDLLGEVVALAKDFASDMHHVLGMGIVLAEDERLGNQRATGKQFREERFLERL